MPKVKAVAVARSAGPESPAAGVRKSARASAGAAARVELPGLAPGDRRKYIAEAAYFRSLERGSSGDGALADWLAAEREISRRYPV